MPETRAACRRSACTRPRARAPHRTTTSPSCQPQSTSDPSQKEWPDLAIEVVWTSGGINKLEIYRRLRVDEVWFWKNEALTVYGLTEHGYEPRERSRHVPDLDIEMLCRLAEIEPLNEAVRQLRAALGHAGAPSV
ncbi:MAG TPA: Uma2 family endonuclease [Kofleriaceae bacterium]|nr:Uma2 family endonuclease [Kofleriaceae bacterium]